VTEFDKVIPPGRVGKLTASLETQHYHGAITKSIRVTTKEATPQEAMLELKAMIVTPVDVSPSETPVLRTTYGESATAELTLSASDGKPFDVLAITADPTVTVSIRPAPGVSVATPKRKPAGKPPLGAGSSRYVMTITSNKDAAVGNAIVNLSLTTSVHKAATVTLRPFLIVAGRLQVLPPRVYLQPAAATQPQRVSISKPGGTGLEILGVESADPDFAATVSPVTEGREYDVIVTYKGKPDRGPVNTSITVKTNEPGQQTIVVPLAGRM
jgi:hypothetical protein